MPCHKKKGGGHYNHAHGLTMRGDTKRERKERETMIY